MARDPRHHPRRAPLGTRSRSLLAALLAVLLASGSLQGQQESEGRPPLGPTMGSDLVVRPGDVLRVRVWPDADLGGDFPIENSGDVHLPILGRIDIAGSTLEEVRAHLRERYSEAMRNPIVGVSVLFRVSVLGAVLRPGLYVAEPTSTLFDMISEAGGFRENADTEQVRIVRHGQTYTLDVESMLSGGESLDLQLRSGDRILVPGGRSFGIRDVLTVLQSLAVIVTLVTVL